MSSLTLTEISAGQYQISGSLTFAYINKQLAESFKTIKSQAISIDFANVIASDSAGLALMIEWIRYSQLQDFSIQFKHIPEQLLALAKLTGLDKNKHFAVYS